MNPNPKEQFILKNAMKSLKGSKIIELLYIKSLESNYGEVCYPLARTLQTFNFSGLKNVDVTGILFNFL